MRCTTNVTYRKQCAPLDSDSAWVMGRRVKKPRDKHFLFIKEFRSTIVLLHESLGIGRLTLKALEVVMGQSETLELNLTMPLFTIYIHWRN